MRYVILPTFVDSMDEKGNAVKVGIYIAPSRMCNDGTRFIIHEEHLPPELKKYVRSAVDLEGTETKGSQFDSKVLVTKARAWMETAAWKAATPEDKLMG